MEFKQDSSHFHIKIPKNIAPNELEELIYQLKGKLKKNQTIDEQLDFWIKQQLMMKGQNSEIPDWVINAKDWQSGWVPILLLKQSESAWSLNSIELIKSYFDTDLIIFILSNKQMFLLVSNLQLQLDKNRWLELDEFALGLYELFQAESNEAVRVGIHFPNNGIKQLIMNGQSLIRDADWVTKLWKDITLFAPWNHQFERILSTIPYNETNEFFYVKWELDHELLHTMEVFFKENLNMSETARKLFIHRNTLQYRLDKIKQQTGLDIKKFEEAMLAKIYLFLLYKLHKNN